MLSDIDQFGREMNPKNGSINNKERSKKILHSLSEIKKLLENKNFIPEQDEKTPNNNLINISSNEYINFDNLKLKVKVIERKINSLDQLLNSK